MKAFNNLKEEEEGEEIKARLKEEDGKEITDHKTFAREYG